MAFGLDADTLTETLQAIREFTSRTLPVERILDLDRDDECPVDTVHQMCGDELGIQLVFVPEEFGGMSGATFDVYRVCETMASIDLGLATSVFATFLGTDPITVAATPDQQKHWLGRVAEEGLLFAYGATEPEAGSDLGALKTKAVPVEENGQITGYRITGRKQWISNGGIADAWTILANTEGGPTWFILEKGAEGFSAGKREDKHGIRLSNTAALFLDDVYVPVENLIGAVEGQGLVQAQLVFGYTRVMVAAFGLGAGWSAVDRAVDYSTQRKVGGTPLSEKQGYTHKLIVPNAIHLEAARAYIEETSERIDAGERGQPQHRRCHRQVHGDRKRQHRRRGRDPGARRLRLHPRVHGRKDQAGRPDHHDLRGHLRDHGDDHRPGPLAAAPQDPRGATTTTPPRSLRHWPARDPASGAGGRGAGRPRAR